MQVVERNSASRALAICGRAALWAAWAVVHAHSGIAHAESGRRLPSIATPAPTSVVEMPVVFEPNRGQLSAAHRFLGRARSGYLLFDEERMHFVPSGATSDGERNNGERRGVSARFLGAARNVRPDGVRPLPSASNYFTGDGSAGAVDVPHFGGIRYREIYPGIDAVFYGHGAAFEFDLLVRAGADPAQIRLAFDGAEDVALDADGDLILRTKTGALRQRVPDIYQVRNGERAAVRGRYLLEPDHSVSIDLGEYDPSLPLVIDPVIGYSTYLGGSGDDDARALTTDAAGNVYVAGGTLSPNFPLLNPYQTKGSSSTMTFVSKFGPGGSLIYSTYISTSQGNWAVPNGIAVDGSGNAYLAGPATDGFPTSRNAYQTRRTTSNSAFVAKLSAAGNQLLYATYVNYASVTGIAVDSGGNAYVAGDGYVGFGTTAGSFQPVHPGIPGMFSPFVLKLNATGTAPLFSTFVGGTTFDSVNGLALDAAGNAVIVGQAISTDFPLASPIQSTFANPGNGHAFIAKLNATGTGLLYSTLLGGTVNDEALAVAVDQAGAVYVAGTTSSHDFPLAQPYQSTAYPPNYVSFVAKLSPAGDRLLYSTYLGGTCGGVNYPYCSTWAGDAVKAIAVDAAGRATVVGNVVSPYFPLVDSLVPAIPAEGGGIFVTQFTASGSNVLYSTLIAADAIGGSSPRAVAIDPSGNAWVAGTTNRTDFPVAGQSLQVAKSGGTDAFLLKLSASDVTLSLSSSGNPVVAGTAVTLRAQVTGGQSGGTVWFVDGAASVGSAPVSSGVATLVTNLATGIRKLQAIYRDGARASESALLHQVVNPRDTCP